jgi:hypothetical protein
VFSIDEMPFYYASPILITNVKTQARKGLILCNSANEIITFEKHVYVDHCMITKIFVNNMLREPYERQPPKKILHVNETTIFNFLLPKILIRKMICNKSSFWKI